MAGSQASGRKRRASRYRRYPCRIVSPAPWLSPCWAASSWACSWPAPASWRPSPRCRAWSTGTRQALPRGDELVLAAAAGAAWVLVALLLVGGLLVRGGRRSPGAAGAVAARVAVATVPRAVRRGVALLAGTGVAAALLVPVPAGAATSPEAAPAGAAAAAAAPAIGPAPETSPAPPRTTSGSGPVRRAVRRPAPRPGGRRHHRGRDHARGPRRPGLARDAPDPRGGRPAPRAARRQPPRRRRPRRRWWSWSRATRSGTSPRAGWQDQSRATGPRCPTRRWPRPGPRGGPRTARSSATTRTSCCRASASCRPTSDVPARPDVSRPSVRPSRPSARAVSQRTRWSRPPDPVGRPRHPPLVRA